MKNINSFGTLYVVATPIGNLRDISLRALDVLRSVDAIAAEDTRVSGRLLAQHGISNKMISLHQHNERGRSNEILDLLANGKNVALISDAGTPGISDPGAILVRTARALNYPVCPVPGASALATALSVSGLNAGDILFLGFLPSKAGARRSAIERHKDSSAALVIYEAPHRVIECIADLAACLSQPASRNIIIARELTKMFESIHECTLLEAASWLKEDVDRQRGEFVLIVTGATEVSVEPDWEGTLQVLMKELPLTQAVQLTCKLTESKRNAVYERALQIQKQI